MARSCLSDLFVRCKLPHYDLFNRRSSKQTNEIRSRRSAENITRRIFLSTTSIHRSRSHCSRSKELRSREKRKKISSSACLDRQFYADKSVLAAASKVFQSYFQDDQLDSIEILDVTVNEMMDLLQFLYPQFPCTITNDNVTSLLILGKGHLFDVCEMTG